MHPSARARHVLARRPWLYWLGAVVLAVAAGLVAARAGSSVDAARRSWGATRPVLVASRDLAPGDALDGHVVARDRPLPMVPAGALTAVDATARARQHLAAGEILVTADVVATRTPRALIQEGWRAVAVAEAVPSGAAVGDPVGVAAGGTVLAGDAVVVGHVGESALVAVPAGDAPDIAAASAAGGVSLLLRP